MHEIMRTNDPVALSFAQSLMKDAGIYCMITDQAMSILEGSVGILQSRLLIDATKKLEAIQILTDAGLGEELRP